MVDFFAEICATIEQNRLRAILTGFSMAWGIFMLIILLGAGNGLQHGMENNFASTAKNTIWLSAGITSIGFEGFNAGRRIQLKNEDFEALRVHLAGIDNISGRFYISGNLDVSYKQEYGRYNIESIMPEMSKIMSLDQIEGRFINEVDMSEHRKSAVISSAVRKSLFKQAKALGEYIKIRGVSFLVVGVVRKPERVRERVIYLPLATSQKVFNGANNIGDMGILTNALSVQANKKIEVDVRHLLAQWHYFDAQDMSALFIWNALEDFKLAQGVFSGIKVFIWVIGIMTIIAGIVGLSNIMYILVKERTREIGIRKALGASPFSIVWLVLSESVFITLISGFLGLVGGMATLALINRMLIKASVGSTRLERVFFNPTAETGVALTALFILVLSGLIAGSIPAFKAVSIKPVEAIFDE